MASQITVETEDGETYDLEVDDGPSTPTPSAGGSTLSKAGDFMFKSLVPRQPGSQADSPVTLGEAWDNPKAAMGHGAEVLLDSLSPVNLMSIAAMGASGLHGTKAAESLPQGPSMRGTARGVGSLMSDVDLTKPLSFIGKRLQKWGESGPARDTLMGVDNLQKTRAAPSHTQPTILNKSGPDAWDRFGKDVGPEPLPQKPKVETLKPEPVSFKGGGGKYSTPEQPSDALSKAIERALAGEATPAAESVTHYTPEVPHVAEPSHIPTKPVEIDSYLRLLTPEQHGLDLVDEGKGLWPIRIETPADVQYSKEFGGQLIKDDISDVMGDKVPRVDQISKLKRELKYHESSPLRNPEVHLDPRVNFRENYGDASPSSPVANPLTVKRDDIGAAIEKMLADPSPVHAPKAVPSHLPPAEGLSRPRILSLKPDKLTPTDIAELRRYLGAEELAKLTGLKVQDIHALDPSPSHVPLELENRQMDSDYYNLIRDISSR